MVVVPLKKQTNKQTNKQMRELDMLQSFGSLFLVGLNIYYEFERVKPGHYLGNPKMFEFECA